jgi:hypothetical protein
MSYDADGISATSEYGYCKFFMLYDGVSKWPLGSSSSAQQSHNLFLAHSQEPDMLWELYLPSGSGLAYPEAGDIMIANTGIHNDGDSGGDWSFTGVPDLIWDPTDDLWRAFFVTEDYDRPNIQIAESADDGLTWGIGGHSSQPNDCWDSTASGGSGAYDRYACQPLSWSSNEPPVPENKDTNPFLIDPDVFLIDADGDGEDELGMLFGGADKECRYNSYDTGTFSSEPLVLLFQYHEDFGDLSDTDEWQWVEEVHVGHFDTGMSKGVIVDEQAGSCEWDDGEEDHRTDEIADPTVVRYSSNKYILFYQMDGNIYVSASGFACSDFVDNDGWEGVDFPDDPDCYTPTTDSEGPLPP